jgi:hypothetical protein
MVGCRAGHRGGALGAAAFDALPMPALIVAADGRLRHANATAVTALGLGPDDLDRPVGDVLPFDLGPVLEALLGGAEIRGETVPVGGPAGDEPTLWALSATAITDPNEGPHALICLEETATGAHGRTAERGALHDLARLVAIGPQLEAVYERVVDTAAQVTNAGGAALYVARHGGGLFVRVAAAGRSEALEGFEAGDVAADVWEAVLGRAGLVWTPQRPGDAPPFAGRPGWASGLAGGGGGGGGAGGGGVGGGGL